MRAVHRRRGFTLVELMIVVAIVGILAALGTYGVRRYLATSKTAEALANVGGIAKALRASNAREHMSGTLLTVNQQTANNGPAGSLPGLCADSTLVPSSIASVTGKKYQPNHAAGADYNTGDQFTGWRCLGFSISSPHYYQYRYKTNGLPAGVTISGGAPAGVTQAQTWSASAQGDIDGDAQVSWFVLQGYINDKRDIVQAPAIGTIDSEE